MQSFSQQKMNVIFILADDHRYDAMGFYNKYDGLKTPNMDKMSREGLKVIFRRTRAELHNHAWVYAVI